MFSKVSLSNLSFYLARYFIRYYRLCRAVKNIPEYEKASALLSELKNKYGFKFRTRVISTGTIGFPSEFGIFKQTIFINNYDYSKKELEYILAHELVHFHIKSNIINMFTNILCCIYWWNPFVRLLKNRVENISEIYVDDFVTRELSKSEKAEYMGCVFKVYRFISVKNMAEPLTESITGRTSERENTLLDRFKIIAENKKANIPICVFMTVMLCVYIFISLRFTVKPCGLPQAEDYINKHIAFTDENSYIAPYYHGGYAIYYEGKPIILAYDQKELEITRWQSRFTTSDYIPKDYINENGDVSENYAEMITVANGGLYFVYKQ